MTRSTGVSPLAESLTGSSGGGAATAGTGQRLYERARRRIPGGTQLLSKRPEMFLPEAWPAYFSRARGPHLWDLDGRRYTDMSYNGIGACVLGYADPDVDAAVKDAIDCGTAATLNCAEEVHLADLLCELHPWAAMVRYARSGGEAMAIAVRIARARTRRDTVAFCGYHGWHDWYLAANLASDEALDGHLLPGLDPAGVPRGLVGTARPFRYNRVEELHAIVRECGDDLAAIVMEPVRGDEPQPGFLDEVRDVASRVGAVLVVDEITAGFRLTTGGAHLRYGLVPDIAVFAKALGNGYPIAAVIGTGDTMQAAQNTFISSTNWTERIGPAAALAMLRKHRAVDAPRHLAAIGEQVSQCWVDEADQAGLPIHVGGIKPLMHFAIEHEESQAAHTLFTQLLLEKGYLATRAFYATTAHTAEHAEEFRAAVRDAFGVVAAALRDGSTRRLLAGPVAHTGFRRLA